MLLPYFPREFPCLSAWVSPYEYSCVASFVSGIWTLQCLPRAFPCESGHALPSAFPSILVSPWVPWTVPSCALRALPCSFNLNPYPNSNFIYKPNLPRSLMSSRWVRSYVPRAFTVGSLMGLVVSYTTQSLVRFFCFYVGDFSTNHHRNLFPVHHVYFSSNHHRQVLPVQHGFFFTNVTVNVPFSSRKQYYKR